MPQERANSVGLMFKMKHGYRVSPVALPALHHAKCNCNISRNEWVSNWRFSNNGIYDAQDEVDARLSGDNSYITKVVRRCRRNCHTPCFSSVDYLHRIYTRNPTQSFEINGYAFATIIIDSDVTTYTGMQFRNLTEVIWFLNLYGCYIDGKYTAFPWTNQSGSHMTLWEGVRIRIINDGIALDSKVDDALIVLSDPGNIRWSSIRILYEQLLSTLFYNDYHTLHGDHRILFNVALAEFKHLMHRDPDINLIDQHGILRA